MRASSPIGSGSSGMSRTSSEVSHSASRASSPPLGGVAGRCQVALVEDEVQHRSTALEPGRELRGIGDAVRDARVADLALGAHEALGDGRLGDEERARHRRGLEAAHACAA